MNGHLESFHGKITRFMDDLIIRGQETGALRSDIPPDRAQRLMHALGQVMSADILGEYGAAGRLPAGHMSEEELARIEKFIAAMHDLGKRIFTPEEDLKCFTLF
jgi:hypothetical protein